MCIRDRPKQQRHKKRRKTNTGSHLPPPQPSMFDEIENLTVEPIEELLQVEVAECPMDIFDLCKPSPEIEIEEIDSQVIENLVINHGSIPLKGSVDPDNHSLTNLLQQE